MLLALAAAATPTASASPAPSHLTLSLTTDPFLDAVTLFLVVATGILALKTWQLHAATVALATDTVQATRVADRHQQETLSPVCLLRHVQYEIAPDNLLLRLDVLNVGSGSALALHINIIPVDNGVEYTGDTKDM